MPAPRSDGLPSTYAGGRTATNHVTAASGEVLQQLHRPVVEVLGMRRQDHRVVLPVPDDERLRT